MAFRGGGGGVSVNFNIRSPYPHRKINNSISKHYLLNSYHDFELLLFIFECRILGILTATVKSTPGSYTFTGETSGAVAKETF